MRISVLGCGRWGSFLAWYLCRTGHEVTLYGRAASWRMERLLKYRENDLLQIPEGVQLTTDLAAAVSRAEALVISVGVQSLRSFLRELAGLDLSGRALVLCMKGLEAETGLRITEIVAQELGPIPCAIWVGPGHVQDFLRGVPNCMVIDSADAALREALVRAFSSDLIRFYYGHGYFIHSTDESRGYIRALLVHELQLEAPGAERRCCGRFIITVKG